MVNQEIRNTVEDKIPQRIEDLLNFSFNNSQMECGKMSNNDNHNTSGKNKEQDGQLLEPLWGKFNDVEEVRR